jgi:hypothetical protein
VVFSFLTAVLRDHCNANEIAYSLLATKDGLRELVRGIVHKTPVMPTIKRGWRGEAVGPLLDGLLRGELAVRVAQLPDGLRLQIENDGPSDAGR